MLPVISVTFCVAQINLMLIKISCYSFFFAIQSQFCIKKTKYPVKTQIVLERAKFNIKYTL
ncbi:hypothetical protein EGY07_07590 [Chryseobacterium indologenes]|nr:hypothetical protein CEQ15_08260 [Chryseobacterium indologenes]ATN05567.1 hypothetical protein CRN76_09220 [Chryseobacterium indologenes]AYY85673.1 hypothetical protein EGX91_14515 [Chryseobacterium indologenes]AYZ35440.1 hypothetical protein EGY07_07590 [Chryseobacterium indologenes]HAO29129.1 hypothetical protein [Chryseobacterium indologenes]